MSAHTSRTFLHSCLKTPIDPCNNCPAPIYNRPKMYLGRLTDTPITITTATKYATSRTRKGDTPSKLTETEVENEAIMWGACSGVRSLAKLYDSIPDYCDINHLSEGDFYSTLSTLRTTCNELKMKPFVHCESSCSNATVTTTATANSSLTQKEGTKKKKPKSTAKKKGSKCAGSRRKAAQKPVGPEETTLESSWRLREAAGSATSAIPCDVIGCDKTTVTRSNTAPKSNYKRECEAEVAAFRRSLKDFEEELKRASYSAAPARQQAKPVVDRNSDSAHVMTKIPEGLRENGNKVEVEDAQSNKGRPTTSMRDRLKKCFSFNDLHSIAESDESLTLKTAENTKRMSKAEIVIFHDRKLLSNYFPPKPDSRMEYNYEQDLPRIMVDIPTSEMTSPSEITIIGVPPKDLDSKKQQNELKLPFPAFRSSSSKKENIKTRSASVSPKHPVARPNLAATLRVEVSKKKLKELHNTCTYHDATPTVDWEVRKTPAWKSLTLNETHKQILALRLATRKAEQDLQKREYDLNMELMRQRVKSAPLLLEGVTFWGPNVGKLTHSCQMDGMKHSCHSSLRKHRKKSGGGGDIAASGNKPTNVGGGSDCGIACGGSRLSNKLQSLRKIYASSAGTCSRQSQRSAASEGGCGNKQKRKARSRTPAPPPMTTTANNDSGDELCSVDRAYL